MADFRALLQGLGYTGVRTLLNSGNAIFSHAGRSADRHAKAVHAVLLAGLGLDLRVVVVSQADFDTVVEQNPLAPAEEAHPRLLVAFAQEPAAVQGLSALAPLVGPNERFVIGQQAAYLLCTAGILESQAARALLGKPGRAITTRNWATVLKLRQLLLENAA